MSPSKAKKLTQVAIDEIAIRKGYRYLTIVLDLKSAGVVPVGKGKGAEALDPFWKRLRGAKAKVEAVAWICHRPTEALLLKIISNGPLEGTNNKIKTIKRQAYGPQSCIMVEDICPHRI